MKFYSIKLLLLAGLSYVANTVFPQVQYIQADDKPGIIVNQKPAINPISLLKELTEDLPPYKNMNLPVENRVQDLLSRMTPEEKFWQLFMIPVDLEDGKDKFEKGIFGLQISSKGSTDAANQILEYNPVLRARNMAEKINAIQKYFVEETRLGIPIIAFEEALHGLVATGATTFPQAIALAATWDTQLMDEVASAIAHETKIRGIRQVLSPVVNIANDVRWGRVEETYGEDPFLVSEMGVAFVHAFEKMGIVTTPKHFIANVGDGGRDSYPIDLSERILEEIHFPPFRACIHRGGSRSIMTSYNSLNGSPCTANDWLLNTKLKGQMNFTGFVISDASAVGGANVLHYTAIDYPDASANAINRGLDVIFQTDFDHYKLFIPPFLDCRIDDETIDNAVARVLRIKFELGLFENPYVDLNEAGLWDKNSAHKDLAKKAALKSIVLLKNDRQILPIQKSLTTIAVIGTDAIDGRLGGYSGPGNGVINILEGIKNKVGQFCQIEYSPGCGREKTDWVTIPKSNLSSTFEGKTLPGLHGEYFNNIDLSGNPALTRMDDALNFRWTLYSPDPVINYDFFSVRWTGKIKASQTGHFNIGIEGNDGYRLFLDGELLIDNWHKTSYSTKMAGYNFEQDKEYDIRVEFFESSGSVWFKLIWDMGFKPEWNDKINEAIKVAESADVVIIVAGIEEGEGYDRATLHLPGYQEDMINRVARTGKPVMVILIGGSAITMSNWIDNIDGVILAWYPGEEGGNAIADVIFGDYSPSGKLPITFPCTEGQVPLVFNHKPTGRNDDYGDHTGKPLFPFGYGLSYTRFDYSNLNIEKRKFTVGDSCLIRFHVKNSGKYDSDEVVQLYIADMVATVARPVKELKGFRRIHFKAGEQKEVTFNITPELLKMLNDNMDWVIEPGEFRIMIGASSTDIRLRDIVTVTAGPDL